MVCAEHQGRECLVPREGKTSPVSLGSGRCCQCPHCGCPETTEGLEGEE